MKASEQLDLALPAEIMDLGKILSAIYAGIRVSYRPGSQQPTTDQVEAIVERVLAMVKSNSLARKYTGIKERGQGQDDAERRVRIKVFALLAFRSLGQPASRLVSELSDLANASMDPKLPPGEAILRARNVIGKMTAGEGTLLGVEDDGVYTKVHLPFRSLEFLSGGSKNSVGFLTVSKLVEILDIRDGRQAREPSPNANEIPSARRLYEQVRELVIGCDPQMKILASRIALHSARADMLARGVKDTGVGNQVILIFGSSGSGKTFAVQELARLSNFGFISFDASTISGEGWAGAKVEDPFKQLQSVCKNDRQRAIQSIVCYDEVDKILKTNLNSAEHRLSVQAEFLRPLGGETIICGGKRMQDCRPFTHDCKPNCFIFSGVFKGLAELARRGTSRPTIGFNCVEGEKVHADFRRALSQYGCIDELCNRISCFIGLPDPTADSIAKAIVSEQGIVAGYNRVLAGRDIVLFAEQSGVNLLSSYGVETKSFFRGVKHIIGSVVEEVLFDGPSNTIMLDDALIRRAIDRSTMQDSDSDHGIKPPASDDSQGDDSEGEKNPEPAIA